MIETSVEYKQQVISEIQNWIARLKIDYTDYNLDNTISVSINDPDPTSDGDQLADGKESPTYKWWSWSNFEWGQHLRSAEHTTNEKGGLSNRLSSPNTGNFPNGRATGFGYKGFGYVGFTPFIDYPKFTVSFKERTVSTLKVVFDDKLLEWAKTFDINIYVGTTLSDSINVTNNTTYRYTHTLSSSILLATSIEVVIKKWNHISSKAKIMESFTSISQTYSQDELIKISIYEEVDPKGATNIVGNMTSNRYNATILNLNSTFDNDNDVSILSGNIIKNRRLSPSFILNNLTGDELQGGIFYSTKWTVDNNKMTAQVSGQDIIGIMSESEYMDSQFFVPGIDEVFSYTTTADFNTFTLDNMVVGTNQILFGGSAILCSVESTGILTGFGYKGFGYVGFNNNTFCGTAKKTVFFTYTPGTTATIKIDYNGILPTGSKFTWYISYKIIEEFTEIDIVNGFSYLPENPTETSQSFEMLLVMETPGTSTIPSVQDITVTVEEKITLLSLASLVIESYDNISHLIEGNYFIDQNYGLHEIPVAYITPKNYTDALRLICEAGGGRGFSDRTGALVLKTLETVSTADRAYTNYDLFGIQKNTNPQTLFNKVTVLVNTLEQVSTDEELAKGSVSILDTEVKTITLKYKTDSIPADDITISGLPSGVTDSTIYYVWGAEITLTNASGGDETFTLTVSGKPYRLIGSEIIERINSESIRLNGVIEYIVDNPLIQTIEQAEQVAENIASSFGIQKREVDASILPDPSIELGDTLSFNDNFYLVDSGTLTLSKGLLTHDIGGKR